MKRLVVNRLVEYPRVGSPPSTYHPTLQTASAKMPFDTTRFARWPGSRSGGRMGRRAVISRGGGASERGAPPTHEQMFDHPSSTWRAGIEIEMVKDRGTDVAVPIPSSTRHLSEAPETNFAGILGSGRGLQRFSD